MVNAGWSQPYSPSKRRGREKKKWRWSTFTSCGFSRLSLSLWLTWIVTACVLIISQSMSLWSLHLFKDVSACPSRSPPPTPTCVCRRHSSYPSADILCSDKITFLPWPVQGWALIPRGLVLSCAPSGKCALSLSFVLLIFSEFLLGTSPCAGLWRCNTETPSLFPHPQTIPFLPNQAECVNEVLPFLS